MGERKNRENKACRVVPGGSAFRSILLGSVMGQHSHSPHTFEIRTSARPQFFFGSLAKFAQSSGGGTQRPRKYGLYSGPRWVGSSVNFARFCHGAALALPSDLRNKHLSSTAIFCGAFRRGLIIVRVEHKNRENTACGVVPGGSAMPCLSSVVSSTLSCCCASTSNTAVL